MKALSDLDAPIKLNDCQLSHLSYVKAGRATQKVKLLWIVLGLRISLFLVELGTGLWTHSLSLLAGSGHMLLDVITLGLALMAAWLAQRPSTGQATFGHQRVEILVALVNGLGLMAIAAWIAWEAVGRFQSPEPVLGLPMLVVAGLVLGVNSLNISLLHSEVFPRQTGTPCNNTDIFPPTTMQGMRVSLFVGQNCNSDSQYDLNLRGVLLHVAADAASSFGVILAALVIYWCNWLWADAAASLFVASLLSLSALPLVWDSLRIVMEYAPRSINVAKVEAFLSSNACVRQVKKLHVWTITSGQVALCAHLVVEVLSSQERDRLLGELQAHLNDKFGIRESTLQLTAFDEGDRTLCGQKFKL